MKLQLLLVVLLVSMALGDCPTKPDMVTSLKDFDPRYPFPCSYSGFVTVDEPTDSNLFYWFFRDEDLSDDAPLVLWVNGGPGSSSQFGNLIENGPFKLVKGDDGVIRVHALKGQAWNAVANIVFLDQPVGVGYSYGHMEITDVSQIKNHTIEFIKGFYTKHPEMKGRDFFITGESYGGKYEPAMASGIIDYNAQVSEEEQIPLKGVLIGNGFVDPVVQRTSIRHLALGLGSVQFDSIPEIDIMEKRCHASNAQKDIRAPDVCGDVSGFFSGMDGGMDMYDSRWLASNSSYQDELVNDYLNYPEVIRNLHVESSTKETKFALGNETIYENFIKDGMLRYIDDHQKILDNNITLLIFVGQFDRKDGPYGVQEWMKKLEWEGMQDFYYSSRNLYYYTSDDNGEIRLGGNFKRHKNLNLLMIYAAGHMVPSTQLALSRDMLSDIIYDGGLQCHHAEGKCSLDHRTCNLMKNCTGHGECITGKCHCESGYFGADCSITTTSLSSGEITLNATEWVYFKIGERTKLTVKSDPTEVYVYTRKGDVPSQSFSNWFAKGTKVEINLDSKNSGEFVALFNPDLDNSITVQISAVSQSSIFSSTFWVLLSLGIFFTVLCVFNMAYFCRNRRNSKTHIPTLLDNSVTINS